MKGNLEKKEDDLNAHYIYQLSTALTNAVGEHRWHDAIQLFPLVLLTRYPHLSPSFTWKMGYTILSNFHGITSPMVDDWVSHVTDLRKFNHRDVLLERFASLVPTVSEDQLKDLLKTFIPYSQLKNLLDKVKSGRAPKPMEVHKYGITSGILGLIYYLLYKKVQKDIKEQPLSSWNENLSSMSDEDNDPTHLIREAYYYLGIAFKSYEDPCDWLMDPYLEVVTILYGKEKAVKYLAKYVEKHDEAPTAQLFAYNYCIKNNIKDFDLEECLEKISNMWPDHPVVLQYVRMLLRSITNFSGKYMGKEKDEEDSGMEEITSINSDDSKMPAFREAKKKFTCRLETQEMQEKVILCMKKLCRFLEHVQWQDDVVAWSLLGRILAIIHRCWLNCWKPGCVIVRKKVTKYTHTVLYLPWTRTVWSAKKCKDSSPDLAIYWAYSSYVMTCDKKLVKKTLKHLKANGHKTHHNHLESMVNIKGPFLEKVYEKFDKEKEKIKQKHSEWLSGVSPITPSLEKQEMYNSQENTNNEANESLDCFLGHSTFIDSPTSAYSSSSLNTENKIVGHLSSSNMKRMSVSNESLYVTDNDSLDSKMTATDMPSTSKSILQPKSKPCKIYKYNNPFLLKVKLLRRKLKPELPDNKENTNWYCTLKKNTERATRLREKKQAKLGSSTPISTQKNCSMTLSTPQEKSTDLSNKHNKISIQSSSQENPSDVFFSVENSPSLIIKEDEEDFFDCLNDSFTFDDKNFEDLMSDVDEDQGEEEISPKYDQNISIDKSKSKNEKELSKIQKTDTTSCKYSSESSSQEENVNLSQLTDTTMEETPPSIRKRKATRKSFRKKILFKKK